MYNDRSGRRVESASVFDLKRLGRDEVEEIATDSTTAIASLAETLNPDDVVDDVVDGRFDVWVPYFLYHSAPRRFLLLLNDTDGRTGLSDVILFYAISGITEWVDVTKRSGRNATITEGTR